MIALPFATVAAILPPAEWGPADTLRGALGFWLLLAGPILGAVVGSLIAGRSRSAEPARPRKRYYPRVR